MNVKTEQPESSIGTKIDQHTDDLETLADSTLACSEIAEVLLSLESLEGSQDEN